MESLFATESRYAEFESSTTYSRFHACLLKIRRASLLTADKKINARVFKLLDDDRERYDRARYDYRRRALRNKVYMVAALFGAMAFLDYWDYAIQKPWSADRHVANALRSGVMVPICILLLFAMNSKEWFL